MIPKPTKKPSSGFDFSSAFDNAVGAPQTNVATPEKKTNTDFNFSKAFDQSLKKKDGGGEPSPTPSPLPKGETSNSITPANKGFGFDNIPSAAPNNAVSITTPDGASLPLNTKPDVLQSAQIQGLQDRVNKKIPTPDDIQFVAKESGKSLDAAKAYLTQSSVHGAAVENNKATQSTKNKIADYISKYNSAYGTQFDINDITSSSAKLNNFLQLAKNTSLKTAQNQNLNQPLNEGDKNKFSLQFGLNDITDAMANQVVQKTVQEDKKAGIPKDETVINIAKKLNPKDFQRTQAAIADSKDVSYNPLKIFGSLFDDNKSEDELLNYQKGVAELQYNKALKQNAINDISQGVVNNDQNLIKSGREDLASVDNDVVYKYPSLIKQQIAKDVNDEIAKESGVVVGSDANSLNDYKEKIVGAFPDDRINAMRKLGYLDNPKTKDIALSMASNDSYFADNSILGGIAPNIAQPFKDLGLSIGDITGFRTGKNILADKIKDDLFQKDFSGNNPNNPEQLQLKPEIKYSRTLANTTANLAGMLAVASLTEGVGTEAGLAAKTSQQLGAYTSFGLPSFDASLKDSKNFIDSEPAQYLYAAINSIANAEGGRVLDLGKITRIPGVSEVFSELAQKQMKGDLTEGLAKEILDKGKTNYVDFAMKYGKNVTKGAATMAYFNTANNVTKMLFGDPNVNADDLLQQAGHAFLDGVLGMSIMGGFGAVADMRNEKNTTYKGTIYNMALNHDAAKDVFDIGLKNGEYTKPEYDQKIKILNTARVAKNSIDAAEQETGIDLTQDQKSVYVANKTAQAVLKNKAEQDGIPEETKNKYLAQADKLGEQSTQVLDGLKFTPTLEPLYDLYDAEKAYNIAKENLNPDDPKTEAELLKAKDNYVSLYSDYLKNNSSPSIKTENGKSNEAQKTSEAESGQKNDVLNNQGADSNAPLAEQIKPFINEVTQPIYKNVLESGDENTINETLKEVAQQANASAGEKKGAIGTFGENIVRIAQEKFPDENVNINQSGELANLEKQNNNDESSVSKGNEDVVKQISENDVQGIIDKGIENNSSDYLIAQEIIGKSLGTQSRGVSDYNQIDVNGKKLTIRVSNHDGYEPNFDDAAPSDIPKTDYQIDVILDNKKRDVGEDNWNSKDGKHYKIYLTTPDFKNDDNAKYLLEDVHDEFNRSLKEVKEDIASNLPTVEQVNKSKGIKNFPLPEKPIDEMTSDELDKHIEEVKKYQKETKLTKEQEDALTPERADEYYGKNLPKDGVYDPTELQRIRNRVKGIEEANTAKEISEFIKRPLIDFARKQDTENLAVIKAAKRQADKLGIPTEEFTNEISKQLKSEFGADSDAMSKIVFKAIEINKTENKKVDNSVVNLDIDKKILKLSDKELSDLIHADSDELSESDYEIKKRFNELAKIKSTEVLPNIDKYFAKTSKDQRVEKGDIIQYVKEKLNTSSEKPKENNSVVDNNSENKKPEPSNTIAAQDTGDKPPPEPPIENVTLGNEGETVGISHKALSEVAKRLGLKEPDRGTVLSPKEYADRGRMLIEGGVDPLEVAKQFKEDGKISPDIISVTRAHGEDLYKKLNDIADKFGENSKEYKDAENKYQDWQDEYMKPMGTKAGATFTSLQGVRNVDTGSFTSLKNYFRDENNREPTFEQTKEIKSLSNQVKDLTNKFNDVTKKLDEVLSKNAKNEKEISKPQRAKLSTQLNDIAKRLRTSSEFDDFLKGSKGDIIKSGFDLPRLKEIAASILEDAAKAVKAGENAIDFIRKAVENLKEDIDKEGLINSLNSIGEKEGLFSIKETPEEKNIARLNKELERLKEDGKLKDKNTKRELSDEEKNIKNQIEQEQDKIKFNNLVTQFSDKHDNSFTPEEAKDIWDYAKKNYLDKGEDFNDTITKTSTDLGLTPKQVISSLEQQKGAKPITNELYRKQRDRRLAIAKAENYVKTTNNSKVSKFFGAIPSFFFRLSVFGHGTVGFITHAGTSIFNPLTWHKYFPLFFRQFKLAYGNIAHYEKAMADLKRDPMFIPAVRAGLAVDPDHVYDDYQSTASADAKKTIASSIGNFMKKVGQFGDRGFNVLKLLRLELYKNEYNKLSDAEKADPDSAKTIASIINNGTGVSNIQLPNVANKVFFAAKLEASRWTRLITQPAKAISTFANWSNATEAQKAGAKIVAKRAASIMVTYAAMLAANQGILSLTGSKQKINFTDPTKSDFLKFKFGDSVLDLSGGMISVFDFLARITHTAFESQKDLKKDAHGDSRGVTEDKQVIGYIANKLSPFAGDVKEVATQHDFSGNTLPYSNDKPYYKTDHKLTWKEYLLSKAPIPLAAGSKEVFDQMRDKGMSTPHIEQILKGILLGAIEGGTGARVSDDYSVTKK